MDNVIKVDFRGIATLSERSEYLQIVRGEVSHEDFADFVEAVDNPKIYNQLDYDMQDLVDNYLACQA